MAHQVASAARGHLDEARRLRDGVPREARAVLLPAVACANTLALLECRDFNVFDPALLARPGGGGAGGGGVTPLWYVLQLKYHLVVGSY